MKLVFPIGSTYITQEETNPSTILNFGTWERVKGKVLVGLDEDDTAFNIIGKTGGEKTHTLTVSEIPVHKHNLKTFTSSPSSGTGHFQLLKEEGWASSPIHEINGAETTSVGGDQSHNNLQPYQVVGYMWIRTA